MVCALTRACAFLALAALVLAAPARAQKQIAITIDDLPMAMNSSDLKLMQSMTAKLLGVLKQQNVPAIGFVNESQLYVTGETDARIAVLRSWLDSGMELGNHTFSHPRLFTTPLPQFQDDVVRGDVVLRRLLGERKQAPRYFRHPFLSTGPSAQVRDDFEAFLKSRGYTVAPVTVDHTDYMFASAYANALRAGDAALATRVREAYLAHLEPALEYFEKLSRAVTGGEHPHVLLIHANQLNADSIEQMLAILRTRGYSFVSLETALKHPAFALKDGYAGPPGIVWQHRWAEGLGKPNKFREDPDPPQFILDLWNNRNRPPQN